MSLESSINLRELLKRYLGGAGFGEVADHLSGLIYHAALRRSGDVGMAEEVTQNVLLQVSIKAGKLVGHAEILGWVHEATRLEVLQMQRASGRRRRREEAAVTTMKKEAENDPHLLADLDDSMRILSASERELVLMRFFEGRTFPAIANETGRSESAEKKRLKKALEKMAGWFGKRGVTLSVAGLTTVLSVEMGKAAPVGLASGVAGASVAGAGSGKLALGVSLLVAAGFAVPVLSKWEEVRELETAKEVILESRTVVRSDREMREFDEVRSERRRPQTIKNEPPEEYLNLSLEDLAWRYRRAGEIQDALTTDRIDLVLEGFELGELEEFGRLLESDLRGLINLLRTRMEPHERAELMMRIRASDNNVASEFARIGTTRKAGEWLLKMEETGKLSSVSGRRDYRNELWRIFSPQVGREVFKSGEPVDPMMIEFVEKGVVMAPLKTRPLFEYWSKHIKEVAAPEGGKE